MTMYFDYITFIYKGVQGVQYRKRKMVFKRIIECHDQSGLFLNTRSRIVYNTEQGVYCNLCTCGRASSIQLFRTLLLALKKIKQVTTEAKNICIIY